MPSLLSDDIKMLADTVDQYVERMTDTPCGSPDHWRDFSDLGWLGLTVGTIDGGLDGGAGGLCAVMQGVGAGLLAEPLLSTGVLGATLIEKAGSAEQRATLLPAIIDGELKVALADREPGAGHDRHWCLMDAKRTAQGYALDGQKQFVADYDQAAKIIVPARIEGGDTSLFLVDNGAAGLSALTYAALDDRLVADLRFEGVELTEDARLPGDTAAALDAAYLIATVGICAEAVGIVVALNALTLDYLKTRRQFGSRLGDFQVLQHRMVDMKIAELEMTASLEQAALLYDAGHSGAVRWVSAAKILAGIGGRSIGEAAVQLHGGMGMTDDLKVGRYLKRLLVIGSTFGDAAWHMDQLASGSA